VSRWLAASAGALLLAGCKETGTDPFLLQGAEAAPAVRAAWTEYQHPERVTITGYDDDAMEPFISPDGATLFFNNNNQPPEQTELHYATRVTDTMFAYQGTLFGANAPAALDGVASVDERGRFYFTSTRSWDPLNGKTQTIFSGLLNGGAVREVQELPGDTAPQERGWINMDAVIEPGGNLLLIGRAMFTRPNSLPAKTQMRIAQRTATGAFLLQPQLDPMVAALEDFHAHGAITYAPAVSYDGLELYITVLYPKVPWRGFRIFRLSRNNVDEPFQFPEPIDAAHQGSKPPYVEAPTITKDGRRLYYHQRDGEQFVLYTVSRTMR